MKLEYDPVVDHKELRALVRLIILGGHMTGDIVSSMSLRVEANQAYGIDIDHHEFAYELDALRQRGVVQYHNSHGGDTQYKIYNRL